MVVSNSGAESSPRLLLTTPLDGENAPRLFICATSRVVVSIGAAVSSKRGHRGCYLVPPWVDENAPRLFFATPRWPPFRRGYPP